MNGSKKNTTGLKIISLVLAVMLWLFVTNENVIITRKEITGVKLNHINLKEGLKASHTDKVSVEIIGTPKKATDINAYIDLKGLEPGIYTLPVKVEPLRGARVTKIRPEQVKVQVFKTEENIFPVTCRVQKPPPAGYTVEGMITVPEKCLVKGPQEVVRKVASVVTFLDLTDRTETSSFYAPARAVDARGETVTDNITLIPDQVKVYVVVGQERTLTKVAVNPTLTGKLPDGYVLGDMRAEPSEVTLIGPPGTPAPSLQVTTSPVSLEGHTLPFTEEAAVTVPQGVSAFPERVRVMVDVKPVTKEESP